MECASCVLEQELEAVSTRSAYRLGRDTHRARLQCFFLTGAVHTQGAVHWVLRVAHTEKGTETMPNSLKYFVDAHQIER